MKVKFYGRLADVLGGEQELEIGRAGTIEEIRRFIARQQPGSAELLLDGKVRACIHDTIVPDDRIVAAGECVEFFPPVSGG